MRYVAGAPLFDSHIDITAPNERSLYLQEASRNWRTREAAKTATDKDAVLIAFSMSHNSELPEKKSTIYQVKRRKERLNESGLRREKAGETPEEDEKEDGWELQTREQLMKKFNIFMEPHHKRTAFLTDRELEIGPSRVFVFKGVKTTVMPTTSQRSMKIGGWNGNDVHIVKTIAMERDLVVSIPGTCLSSLDATDMFVCRTSQSRVFSPSSVTGSSHLTPRRRRVVVLKQATDHLDYERAKDAFVRSHDTDLFRSKNTRYHPNVPFCAPLLIPRLKIHRFARRATFA